MVNQSLNLHGIIALHRDLGSSINLRFEIEVPGADFAQTCAKLVSAIFTQEPVEVEFFSTAGADLFAGASPTEIMEAFRQYCSHTTYCLSMLADYQTEVPGEKANRLLNDMLSLLCNYRTHSLGRYKVTVLQTTSIASVDVVRMLIQTIGDTQAAFEFKLDRRVHPHSETRSQVASIR